MLRAVEEEDLSRWRICRRGRSQKRLPILGAGSGTLTYFESIDMYSTVTKTEGAVVDPIGDPGSRSAGGSKMRTRRAREAWQAPRRLARYMQKGPQLGLRSAGRGFWRVGTGDRPSLPTKVKLLRARCVLTLDHNFDNFGTNIFNICQYNYVLSDLIFL